MLEYEDAIERQIKQWEAQVRAALFGPTDMPQETYSLLSLDEDMDGDRGPDTVFAPTNNMTSAAHALAVEDNEVVSFSHLLEAITLHSDFDEHFRGAGSVESSNLYS